MENYMDDQETALANTWAGYLGFQPNFILKALNHCDAQVIGIFTGNRAGKTSSVAKHYIQRILGECPIEKKNLRPNNPIRTIRLASETLPTEADEGGEVRNTIYPEIKRRLPSYLIVKDITARRPVITVKDPQDGPNINLEFVSYNQEVQSQAGVDRFSIYLDEESPKSFYQEQLPRLITSNGDILLGMTPTENLTWTFEDVFEQAGVMYNSPHIIKYLSETYGTSHKSREILSENTSMAVIRAASDDNPTLTKENIDNKMMLYKSDTALYEMRRYGLFHQISGLIFKSYDPQIHFISRNKYFPDGIAHGWRHARGIDYHPHVNWACLWTCLTQDNEFFVWDEYNPPTDRMTTLEIAREIAYRSRDYKFMLNLIDPLANTKQGNTGLTTLDDLNRAFSLFKREGIGMGGYWIPWDTKSDRGRNEMRIRLQNAKLCGRPFNNRQVKNGQETHLPTMWILDNCIQTNYMMRNWRWQEWANQEQLLTKDEKNKPQDRHSHFPITIECILKHPAMCTGAFRDSVVPHRPSGYQHMMQPRM